MVKKFSKGWGFKIDYAKAIADDDLLISCALRSIEHGWYRRSIPYQDGTGMLEVTEFWMLVLYFRDVSTSVGLSDQDVADYAAYMENDIWKMFPDLPPEQPGRAGYERGKAIAAQIDELGQGVWLLRDETEARAELRRARASLARHVRNREKFDRDQRLRRACGTGS